MSTAVIQIQQFCKSYNGTPAVQDLSLEVHQGEIFGMVGPNGAGKTTTVECMEGLRKPSSGHVSVLGCDPRRDRLQLSHRIGAQLQQAALPDRIKVGEALAYFSGLYGHPMAWEELLEQMGLTEKADDNFAQLSGGQKQRLFIALALVNNPELIFFDELTTGLDPQARHRMWDIVRGIREQGKTVFLTTHFMEEAERLCDRVAIIDQGKLIALDTPTELIRGLSDESKVSFTLSEPVDLAELEQLSTVTRLDRQGDTFIVFGSGRRLVADVVIFLTDQEIPFLDLRSTQPTLEDVFLELTGHELRS